MEVYEYLLNYFGVADLYNTLNAYDFLVSMMSVFIFVFLFTFIIRSLFLVCRFGER